MSAAEEVNSLVAATLTAADAAAGAAGGMPIQVRRETPVLQFLYMPAHRGSGNVAQSSSSSAHCWDEGAAAAARGWCSGMDMNTGVSVLKQQQHAC
jgi:hypothetical protein